MSPKCMDATKNKSFTYDAVDALYTTNGPGGNYSWLYDLAGNRTFETIDSSWKSYDYTAGTNKLATMTGPVWFDYDENGNTSFITSANSTRYYYTDNQRLSYVQDGNGILKAQYTYNGNGQRVKKDVVNGATTIFHYNQNGQIIAESNSSGTITAEYVYLNGQPLAKIMGTNTYYYHNDHLGTPLKMTDGSGQVVWAADYKPFGEATVTISTITNNLRFPGQYFDQETGTHYNYFRDYNPALGRYAQADPIGLKGGLNLYTYVGNKPTKLIDPTGQVGVLGLIGFGLAGYSLGSYANTLYNWLPVYFQIEEQIKITKEKLDQLLAKGCLKGKDLEEFANLKSYYEWLILEQAKVATQLGFDTLTTFYDFVQPSPSH